MHVAEGLPLPTRHHTVLFLHPVCGDSNQLKVDMFKQQGMWFLDDSSEWLGAAAARRDVSNSFSSAQQCGRASALTAWPCVLSRACGHAPLRCRRLLRRQHLGGLPTAAVAATGCGAAPVCLP